MTKIFGYELIETMEEENTPLTPPEQPVAQPTPESPLSGVPGKNWLKIGLLVLAGLTLFSAAAYAGYWYARQQQVVPSSEVSFTPVREQPTPTPTPTPLAVATLKPEPTIPASWKTYEKIFADTHFSFRYPETHEVWDLDEASGEIYIIKEGAPNWPADVTIENLLRIFYGFEQYQSGSRREWFRENLQKLHPDTDLSALAFEEVNFSNGKSYLRVYNWPKTSEFENGAYYQGDFYFGLQNGIAVYVLDKGVLNKDDFLKILFSLAVSK